MLKEKGSCTVPQTQLMSITKEKQHPKTSCMSLTQNRILKYNCDAMIITSITFKHSKHITFRQSQTKVGGAPALDHKSHIPCNQYCKMSWLFVFFFVKKGKNHLIVNFVSGGRGELVWCSDFFVWDCKWRETLPLV